MKSKKVARCILVYLYLAIFWIIYGIGLLGFRWILLACVLTPILALIEFIIITKLYKYYYMDDEESH